MERRSANSLKRTFAVVWMMVLLDAFCFASEEIVSAPASEVLPTEEVLLGEVNQADLRSELFLPFTSKTTPESPCKDENCGEKRDGRVSAYVTVLDDERHSVELAEYTPTAVVSGREEPTEECFESIRHYLKRLEHLKIESLAKEMVGSMKEGNIVKAMLVPLYGLSVNALYTDPNMKDDPMYHGSSLLHWTAYHNAIEHAEMLILKGASIDSTNGRKFSPLHIAAWYGHTSIAEIFVLAGTKIDKTARHSWTPLYIAAREGHLDVVKILLIAGADPNSKSLVGWTPLHVAAWKGFLEIAQLLVDAGSQVELETYSGEIPLNHVCQSFGSQCSDGTRNAFQELLTP